MYTIFSYPPRYNSQSEIWHEEKNYNKQPTTPPLETCFFDLILYIPQSNFPLFVKISHIFIYSNIVPTSFLIALNIFKFKTLKFYLVFVLSFVVIPASVHFLEKKFLSRVFQNFLLLSVQENRLFYHA